MVALRTGLFDFTFDDGSLRVLAPPPFDPRRFVFNDGAVDRQGRFWIGPMYEPLEPGDASPAPREAPFWRYDGNGQWHAGTRPVQIANALERGGEAAAARGGKPVRLRGPRGGPAGHSLRPSVREVNPRVTGARRRTRAGPR